MDVGYVEDIIKTTTTTKCTVHRIRLKFSDGKRMDQTYHFQNWILQICALYSHAQTQEKKLKWLW